MNVKILLPGSRKDLITLYMGIIALPAHPPNISFDKNFQRNKNKFFYDLCQNGITGSGFNRNLYLQIQIIRTQMSYPYQIKTMQDYTDAYRRSVEDPEAFWSDIASHFTWHRRWDRVLEWNFREPLVRWFDGARFNITENCLDRHLEKQGDDTALIWEPNHPSESTRHYTYKQLHKAVCRFANLLKNQGVKKGDRVCIYMGMIPELAMAVLACARIGAIPPTGCTGNLHHYLRWGF
jgi:hypothetical protein